METIFLSTSEVIKRSCTSICFLLGKRVALYYFYLVKYPLSCVAIKLFLDLAIKTNSIWLAQAAQLPGCLPETSSQ